MEMFHHILEINWLAAVVAGTVSFFVGALWYSPLVFGKAWMEGSGMTEEKALHMNPAQVYGISLAASIAAAAMLSMLVGIGTSWLRGAAIGFHVGLFFVAGSFLINYMFEQRPMKLWLVNGGFHTVQFTVMGAILGAWVW
jgi:uncharacterized protein DUF1761